MDGPGMARDMINCVPGWRQVNCLRFLWSTVSRTVRVLTDRRRGMANVCEFEDA